MTVITALTAQTSSGVRNTILTPPNFVAEQLDAVFDEAVPDVIKIGMLGNAGIVEAVLQKLRKLAMSEPLPIVLDTVIASSSGYALLDSPGVALMKEKLLPLCFAITPNIPEAEIITDMKIQTKQDMETCAVKLSKKCPHNIIITGGHLSCDDLLYDGKIFEWFGGEKIESDNTHGTGCKFASALACGVALEKSISDCVANAKSYVRDGL
jgi:hydroxymethylpyrimidine/phosphomethylpyrimidine kinase